jgi:hypothetical protein
MPSFSCPSPLAGLVMLENPDQPEIFDHLPILTIPIKSSRKREAAGACVNFSE